jgi:mRNA interferase RelE/StbE
VIPPAYKIENSPAAIRFLKKLDSSKAQRFREAIDGLAYDQHPPNSTNFKEIEKGHRLRIGDARIIYQVFDSDRVVRILLIGGRKDIYR